LSLVLFSDFSISNMSPPAHQFASAQPKSLSYPLGLGLTVKRPRLSMHLVIVSLVALVCLEIAAFLLLRASLLAVPSILFVCYVPSRASVPIHSHPLKATHVCMPL
jgi:hypothetical protein